MITAKELAKEIIAIVEHYKNYSGDFHDERLRQVAAKLEPLVSDAERWKSECESVRSIANRYEIRADDADRYEQWLLDIGRAIGCQHLDEQLPNCVIQHLQGDQESEATNE